MPPRVRIPPSDAVSSMSARDPGMPPEMRADAVAGCVLVGSDGMATDLHRFVKRLLLVNFWASWCSGCIAEFASMSALQKRLGADAVDIVLLSYPSDWPGNEAWRARHGIGFASFTVDAKSVPLLRSAFFDSEGAYAVPYTLVMEGPRRRVVFSSFGSRDWMSPPVLSALGV